MNSSWVELAKLLESPGLILAGAVIAGLFILLLRCQAVVQEVVTALNNLSVNSERLATLIQTLVYRGTSRGGRYGQDD